VLSPGDPGAWDGGMVLPGLGEPITRGDTCWCYYYGSRDRHDEAGGHGAIGVAYFSHGRIAGQQFEREGWFETAPFRCPGGALFLNAIAGESMTVEIRGCGYGGALEGFTRAECETVQGDSCEHAVRWRSHADLDTLRNRFIALRVYGTNSIAYGASFRRDRMRTDFGSTGDQSGMHAG